MTEAEIIDAAEHLDYQDEGAAGHAEGKRAGLEAEIDALIADAPADPNNPDPAAFCPTDAAGVDWVLGKVADARSRAARIRENAELMARAEERKAEHLEWRYGPALQDFARRELEGGKRKSVRLFHGVLGFRRKPATVVVTDFAAALGWAKAHLPGAVTEALERKALAEALLATGESPDFAQLIPAEDVFFIK